MFFVYLRGLILSPRNVDFSSRGLDYLSQYFYCDLKTPASYIFLNGILYRRVSMYGGAGFEEEES